MEAFRQLKSEPHSPWSTVARSMFEHAHSLLDPAKAAEYVERYRKLEELYLAAKAVSQGNPDNADHRVSCDCRACELDKAVDALTEKPKEKMR